MSSKKGHGRGYDDDDLDGYDDYDDYDAAADAEAAAAAEAEEFAAAVEGGPGSGAGEEFPDAQLLEASFDDVARVVGETFGEGAIVAALRACNYQPELAIGHLLDPPVTRPQPKKQPQPQAHPQSHPHRQTGGAAGKRTGGKNPTLTATTAKGKVLLTASPPPPGSAAPREPRPSATSAAPPQQPRAPVPPAAASAAAATVPASASASAGGQPLPAPAAPLPPVPPEVRAWAEDGKPRLSVVVVGHVDAGKSTLMGHLLADLGVVSSRLVAKFAKEAREAGKASFAYAWVLDEGATERARGITVDVGVNFFETRSARFTLLDAPGHRDFVPNMIVGAAQADVAVLVVDASPGEFEAGFSAGGQTKEHAALVRNFGVTQLVVAVNKLDMAGWAQARFNAVRDELLRYLLQIGFARDKVVFVPVAGLSGVNLVRAPAEALEALVRSGRGGDAGADGGTAGALGDEWGEGGGGTRAGADARELAEMAADLGFGASTADGARGPAQAAEPPEGLPGARAGDIRRLLAWYLPSQPTLVEALDRLRAPPRAVERAFRLSIADVFRPASSAGSAGGGGGVAVTGRIEGGWIAPHTRVVIMPGNEAATVKSVSVNGASVPFACAGDTVDVSLGGIDRDDAEARGVLAPGRVLCWASHPLAPCVKFKAQIACLPTLEMPVVAGQQFQLHSHCAEEPCNVTRLLRTVDRDGHTREARPRVVSRGEVAVVRIRMARPAALELFAESKRLGRFMLRYGGRTVAAGVILKIKR